MDSDTDSEDNDEPSADSGGAVVRAPLRYISVPDAVVPLFVFLHIYKTAGTTMRSIFKKMFREHYCQPEMGGGGPKKDGRVPVWAQPGYFDDKLMIAGHIERNHPAITAIRDRRIIVVAVMRDPVRRVVSFYDYVRRRPEDPLYREICDLSLLEAMTKPNRFRKQCVNRQLRQVFGSARKSTEDYGALLRTGNYILGKTDQLRSVAEAVAAISGLPPVRPIPKFNTLVKASDAVKLSLAADQPDHQAALAAIREANAAEYKFMDEHLQSLLVTFSTKSHEGRGAKGRPGEGGPKPQGRRPAPPPA